MSETLRFYNDTSKPDTLRKNPTAITRNGVPVTATATMLAPYNLEKPSFLLDYAADISGQCNYIQVAQSGFYYFVNEPILLSGGRMQIDCQMDYLMSFQAAILDSEIFADRNEYYFNKYYADERLPQDIRNNRAIYMFPGNPFNDPNFILITAGGEGL